MNNQTELTNKQIPGGGCNDGDKACIGDRWCVCEKGEWVPTGEGFCMSDNVRE